MAQFGYTVLGFGSGGTPLGDFEYLIVSGGGGGGGVVGGGGGAGGYRTSTFTPT